MHLHWAVYSREAYFFYCPGYVGERSTAVDNLVLKMPRYRRWVWCSTDGCGYLGTCRAPFLLFVAGGPQWKGRKGQADCGPCDGSSLRLTCRA